MKRFAMLLCVFIFAVFIGMGIINSDSDPPCVELTEILNQSPAGNIAGELSLAQNFPNPFDANKSTWDNIIEAGIYEVVFSASVPVGYIVYGITLDETQITEIATDNSRGVELNVNNNVDYTAFAAQYSNDDAPIYYSVLQPNIMTADATDNRQSYGAGQNPKVIVVGSVDSFIYNGELDVTVAGQVAYPLIA